MFLGKVCIFAVYLVAVPSWVSEGTTPYRFNYFSWYKVAKVAPEPLWWVSCSLAPPPQQGRGENKVKQLMGGDKTRDIP